jgi:hypothetical protein
VSQETYRAQQENAMRARVAAAQDSSPALSAGLEGGKSFLSVGNDDIASNWGASSRRTPTGSRLGSQFLVRRARLNVHGSLYDRIDFQAEAEFTEGGA